MYRKEIIVASTVFDLGLKGLEEAEESCNRVGCTMELEVAAKVFQVHVSRQERALILHWTGQTLFPAVRWVKFTAIRFRWPPVKSYSCFAEF